MPWPYHLIDGYNLLHAAGLARVTYGPGDLERARLALLAHLADGLDEAERERTTIVFDAADPPPDALPRLFFQRMSVIFSVETGDADTLIEQLIRRHSSPRQLRVVSDDIRLRQAAKRRGARAVKCETFLRQLDRHRKSRRPESEHESSPVANEPNAAESLQGWLDYFGMDSATLETDAIETPATDPSGQEQSPAGSKNPADRRSERGSRPTAGPGPASGTRKRPRTTDSEAQADTPGESLEFWQRRIDEAVAEDANRRRKKPS